MMAGLEGSTSRKPRRCQAFVYPTHGGGCPKAEHPQTGFTSASNCNAAATDVGTCVMAPRARVDCLGSILVALSFYGCLILGVDITNITICMCICAVAWQNFLPRIISSRCGRCCCRQVGTDVCCRDGLQSGPPKPRTWDMEPKVFSDRFLTTTKQ